MCYFIANFFFYLHKRTDHPQPTIPSPSSSPSTHNIPNNTSSPPAGLSLLEISAHFPNKVTKRYMLPYPCRPSLEEGPFPSIISLFIQTHSLHTVLSPCTSIILLSICSHDTPPPRSFMSTSFNCRAKPCKLASLSPCVSLFNIFPTWSFHK